MTHDELVAIFTLLFCTGLFFAFNYALKKILDEIFDETGNHFKTKK